MSNMPFMEVPVPTVDELELDNFMASGRSAREVIKRRQDLKKVIDDAKTEIEELDKELGTALDLRNTKNAVWEDYLLVRRTGSRPRPILDTVLLLDAGVTPQQIKAGTRFSEPGKPGITVRHLSETKAPGYDQSAGE